MKKLLTVFIFILGILPFSNGQIITYNVPVTNLIGMQVNGGDFCFSNSEYEQAAVGNTWGFTWMSTNGNIPNNITVDIVFTIEESAGPYPTTLNGSADASVSPLLSNCGFSTIPYSLNPVNYNPLSLNTFLMDYSASAQDNQIIDALGPGVYARVTVDYCQPTTGIDPLTACDSLTWTNGITYFANNFTAKDTLVNAAGCDSIVTLDLAVNFSTSGTDTRIECDSLVWIDSNTYFTNNTTATHIINNLGCDSVVTLNLTILGNSTTGSDVIVTCDSLAWIDGNTYSSNNSTATHIVPNAVGCDSIITLNLTINNSTSVVDSLVACDSLIWIDGNTYFSSNNTATHIVPNAIGCDSIITLNLTINGVTTAVDSLSACDSLTWIDGNTYFTTNNTATHIMPNAIGCDSVITLNLTINLPSIVTIASFDPDTVCENNSPIILPTGNPAGGFYTGNGVSGNMFNPSVAGVGIHTIYYSFNDSLGCSASDSTQIVVNSCVGINETEQLSGINIFPNPTNDIINIDLENATTKVNITITSIDGKVIYQRYNITDKNVVIDISNNSKGIYFLRVNTANDYKVYKVVKQ